jgi:hypothetical protein
MHIEETKINNKKTIREALDIPRYHAKVIESIKNRPGSWDSINVGVFDGEKQIGSYVRVYSTLFNTFFPFEHGGKWYALVSLDYTRTQLMEMPSCKIIGGEPEVPGGNGFCPVDFYVPNYIKLKYPDIKDEWVYDAQIDVDEWKVTPDNEASFHYFDFGIVSGCVWGDDWSDKIQYLDLSRVAEGIITRSEKFGYAWLPPKVKLADAVNVEMDDPEWYRVGIAIEKTYDINPGSKKDYSKFNAMDD